MNTKFRYRYRRSGRNEPHDFTLVLRGRMSPQDRDLILGALAETWFIPHQVGLPDLHPHIGPDDHPWHELVDITDTNRAANTTWTARGLAREFDRIRTWDEHRALTELGIRRSRTKVRQTSLTDRILGDEEDLLAFLVTEGDLGI